MPIAHVQRAAYEGGRDPGVEVSTAARACTCIDINGVIAYLVAQRTGEMAIRSALGPRAGTSFVTSWRRADGVVAVGLGGGVLALVLHGLAARVAARVLSTAATVRVGVLLLLIASLRGGVHGAGPAHRQARRIPRSERPMPGHRGRFGFPGSLRGPRTSTFLGAPQWALSPPLRIRK